MPTQTHVRGENLQTPSGVVPADEGWESGGLRERFLVDATLQRAFVRSLEIIGEAAKRVPESSRPD